MIYQTTTYVPNSNQMPPAQPDWTIWQLRGRRAIGKTRAAAEMVNLLINEGRALHIALVGPSIAHIFGNMIFGSSGLLSASSCTANIQVDKTRLVIRWPIGAIAFLYSAENPRSLDGRNFDLAWCDEVTEGWYPQFMESLALKLRLGKPPRLIISAGEFPVHGIKDEPRRPSKPILRPDGKPYVSQRRKMATGVTK